MKKLLWCTCTAFLSLAAVSPCLAADSPWNGTWKENLSKGKLTGETVKITAKGSGYTFTNGPVTYDFACDGKPYPTVGIGAISCKPTSDGGFDFTQLAKGQVVSTSHRSFSPDGKTMTMKVNLTAPDGTKSSTEMVRQRKTGTTGLVGEWVDAKVAPTDPGMQVISVKGDMLHVEYPRGKSSVDAKLDGSDANVMGPMVSPGTTVAFKSLGPNKLSYVDKLNGKLMDQGTLTLGPDGKTLTDLSWSAGKENEKTTQVYEKQ